MILDLNHLPGRVKRSDLVQSGRDTSPDVMGGLTRAHEQYITVIPLWERPENTHLGLIRAHSGLWRPLRPNQTDNGRNQSCVWQVGAGWKRPTGPEVMNHDNITQGRRENTHLGSSGPLEASGGL